MIWYEIIILIGFIIFAFLMTILLISINMKLIKMHMLVRKNNKHNEKL